MRKRILLAVLLAIISAMIAASYLHHRNNRNGLHRSLTGSIGRDLIEKQESKYLRQIPPALKTALSQFVTGDTKISEVRLGDEPAPFGDGRATSHIILANNSDSFLSIRIRPDDSGEFAKFEILGFRSFSK